LEIEGPKLRPDLRSRNRLLEYQTTQLPDS
jgi:hypothetical protein